MVSIDPRDQRRSQVKNNEKRKKITKNLVESHFDDNPYLRQEAATLDLSAEGKPVSMLRLIALQHARKMPVSDDGTLAQQIPEHIYSQQAISGASNWVQLGPTAVPGGQTLSTYYSVPNIPALVTGRLTSIVVDPSNTNIIYVGTAQGGIWKTTDGGRNWFATSDYAPSLSIGALVIDPKDSNVLYAGTGEGNISREKVLIGRKHPESYYGCGMLKTTDGGNKWILLDGQYNTPFVGASFFRIAINPLDSQIIFAATSIGLYRSTNGGKDWRQMENGLPVSTNNNNNVAATDLLIHPTTPNIVYVAFRRKDTGDQESAGIYKTSEANSDNPSWVKLDIKDFKPDTCRRISLAMSLSSPDILYALIARDRPLNDNDDSNGGEVYKDESGELWQGYVIDQFYRSVDGGLNWKSISLPGKGTNTDSYPWCRDSIGTQGWYNLYVAADPTTPDIVYLGGVSLWKGVHNTITNEWIITDIGKSIHPDNHAFAFDPKDPFIIYAGNDGGIYKSNDGGETWNDVINEGLCITQFEFTDHHPISDAVVFAGAQDNGTLQFRNSPAFYHSDWGDGGFVDIDPNEPNNIVHQYVRANLYYSQQAGKEGTWDYISTSLREKVDKPLSPDKDKPLFYAPVVLDKSNPRNVAFGAANGVFLASRTEKKRKSTFGNWDTFIPLPELQPTEDKVSAINYVKSELMYVGTVKGKIYQLKKIGNDWKSKAIHASPVPQLYIWDIVTLPDPHEENIIVVMAGYGSQQNPHSHIWLRKVSEDMQEEDWHDISGEGICRLPDTPINAIEIDPDIPDTIYVGTDIGVFRTTTRGRMWIRFSQGLPICAVYDMRLHRPTRLLRIVTHGRGIWERKLDEKSMPDVNLFLRHHLMDTGRFTTSTDLPAGFEDPYQSEDKNRSIALGSTLRWDMCADIKVDTPRANTVKKGETPPPLPSYQMNLESVDYVKFETELYHRDPEQGHVSRVYVQVHNRGIKSAEKKVTVKLFYANAIGDGGDSTRYPDLPPNFWTSFPNDSFDKSNWKPIGEAKFLPDGPKTLTNTEPTVLAWQWNVPPASVDRIGLLAVIDSPSEDPIPEANKVFNIESLVRNERHVGLRTVQIAQ